MSDEQQHNADDLQLTDRDPVWQLLGESPRPEPDAWFAVRTLARCRYEGLAETRGFSFAGAWRWALGTCLGLCLAVALMMAQLQPVSQASDQQRNVQEAFEIVASLRSADTDSSTSVLQDASY